MYFFNYVSKVSFNKPICCIQFVETTSLNLVSERVILLSFLILTNLNIYLYYPKLLLVKLYLILVELYLITYIKLFHLFSREQSVSIFLWTYSLKPTTDFFTLHLLLQKSMKNCYALLFNNLTPSLYVEVQCVQN